jgi:SAM-dependent methyltransferase
MHLNREVEADVERIRYGLLACRCFEFPIVDGILLLSLSKGYGGAEEELQPYVPLQIAAIKHLQRSDVNGLRTWIARHMPLAAALMEGHFGSYLEFRAASDAQLDLAAVRYLAHYEALGMGPPRQRLRKLAGRVYHCLRGAARPTVGQPLLDDFYTARFFAPRVNALALELEELPLDGRLLSLCCGNGVYENLLLSLGGQRALVSIDGQFLNLLCTRRFISPGGVYICHDLQFPLPFVDGAFDGVFSSTCLPEIPAQLTFAREAIRATAETGWTFFDTIWDMTASQRVDESRHYRFCQNHFTQLEDYLDFFTECAGPDRRIALDVPDLPARYLDAPRWITERSAMLQAVRAKTDKFISVLVTRPSRFRGFRHAARQWLSAETLAVSPVFDLASSDGALKLMRKPGFSKLAIGFAPKSFMGYPETLSLERARLSEPDYRLEQFCASVFVPLPRQFARDTQSLGSLLAKV